MNRARLQGYLVLAAVFTLGLVIGGALTHAYAHRRMVERFNLEAPVFAEQHRERALVRKLDLNDAQQTKLHALFEQHGQKQRELAEAMMDNCGADLATHQAQMDADIRALLTSEQAARFDQLLQQRGKHRFMGQRRSP